MNSFIRGNSMQVVQIVPFIVVVGLSLSCKKRNSNEPPQVANSGADATESFLPAENFCKEYGGILKSFKTKDDTSIATCVMGVAKIELLTLYNAKQTKAVEVFMTGGIPSGSDGPHLGNPASIFCEVNGGESRVALDENGEFSYCQFTDKSMMEEWTLFKGLQSPDNEKLKAAIVAARS